MAMLAGGGACCCCTSDFCAAGVGSCREEDGSERTRRAQTGAASCPLVEFEALQGRLLAEGRRFQL